jgi:CHAT domain-containing protein
LKTPGTRQPSFRFWSTLGLLVVVATGALGLSPPHDSTAELCSRATLLASGTSVAHPFAPGQTQAFRVFRKPGEVLDAIVDQHGIDVVVELLSPRGETLLEADDRLKGIVGPEVIFAVPSEPGSYCLVVRPRVDAVLPGSFRMRLAVPRRALPRDRLRAAAYQAFSRGEKLRFSYQLMAAIPAYREAVEDFRTLGDRDREAAASYFLGVAYAGQGDLRKECDSLRSAAAGWKGKKEEAVASNLLGSSEDNLGEEDRGLATLHHAQEIAHRFNDAHLGAGILNNLGLVYEKHGELDKALSAFSLALRQWRKEGNIHEQEVTLSNLAAFRLSVGRAEEALTTASEAVRIAHEHGHADLEADGLLSEGLALGRLGRREEALSALRSGLELSRRVEHRKTEGFILLAIGTEQQQAHQLDQAHRSFEAAFAAAREIGNNQLAAGALESLGEVSGLEGEVASGLEHLAQAQALYQSLGDHESVAATLDARAQILRRAGRSREALAAVEEALPLLETLRLNPGTSEIRASFLASHHATFELDIDQRMQLHDATGAFAVSEKSRSRAILDELAEARVEIRNGADVALLHRQEKLENRLARLEQRQAKEGAQGGGAGPLAAEIQSVNTEIQVTEANIRTGSPKYASLAQPQTLTVEAVQRQLLDDNTALLVYSLGEERSYLWLIRHRSLVSRELPPQKVIEKLAKGVYDLLAKAPQRREQAALDSALAQLGRAVLVPIASELGRDRLLIVSDGALQTIPFGVLPVATPGSRETHPLLVDHEIVNLPSASVLALLRQQTRNRRRPPKLVAVLGDAVFRSDDERLPATVRRAPRVPPTFPLGDVARSARDLGIDGFDRLPFSKIEADAILRFVPRGQGLEALGFAADRKLATGGELGNYQVVHFATHAIADLVHPELSGIVLSLLDSQGRPQNGYLRAYEIYNLSLPVDLVVLSACRTAVGPEIRGEGLSGLTRGFMYAGAPRVLVSLWNVSDKGTAQLMERFYRSFLLRGLRPCAALRAAQLEMLQDVGWKAPYYWAGFVLQGEWR